MHTKCLAWCLVHDKKGESARLLVTQDTVSLILISHSSLAHRSHAFLWRPREGCPSVKAFLIHPNCLWPLIQQTWTDYLLWAQSCTRHYRYQHDWLQPSRGLEMSTGPLVDRMQLSLRGAPFTNNMEIRGRQSIPNTANSPATWDLKTFEAFGVTSATKCNHLL